MESRIVLVDSSVTLRCVERHFLMLASLLITIKNSTCKCVSKKNLGKGIIHRGACQTRPFIHTLTLASLDDSNNFVIMVLSIGDHLI